MIEEIKNYTEKIDTTNIAEELDTLKQDFVDGNERYVIPPIIKTVYQKFINIKTKDDIANIVFNDLEWTALKAKNSEFWNEKYQTGFFGKKMYKSLKIVFPELQQKFLQRQELYVKEHPEKKLSSRELEILANPIEMEPMKVAIGNESYVFIQISIAGEKIAISKPVKESEQSENRYYDIWSVYYPSKKSPLMISETSSGQYLEDIHQNRLNGRYLVGVDGNLYAIDEEMRVMQKDGTRKDVPWNKGYQQYGYDTNMYKGFRSGECKKSGSEYALSLQYSGEHITYQQQESKKEKYIALYQTYAKEHNLEYTLVYKDDGTCYLEKGGIMSICSENILSYTNETFMNWIEKASKNMGEKIKTNEIERSAPEKKQEAFIKYKNIYCGENAKEGDPGVFELKKEHLPKRKEGDINAGRRYGIKLGYRNNDPKNEAHLIIVDMDKNTEVIDAKVMFQITDINGKEMNMENIDISYYIQYYILEYEKNEPK